MTNTRTGDSKSIIGTAVMIGIILASALWLYRFYNVHPASATSDEATSRGFKSPQRLDQMRTLYGNKAHHRDFSDAQFATVDDFLQSKNDSIFAKMQAASEMMHIQKPVQQERAASIIKQHAGEDAGLDVVFSGVLTEYWRDGNQKLIHDLANDPNAKVASLATQVIGQFPK